MRSCEVAVQIQVQVVPSPSFRVHAVVSLRWVASNSLFPKLHRHPIVAATSSVQFTRAHSPSRSVTAFHAFSLALPSVHVHSRPLTSFPSLSLALAVVGLFPFGPLLLLRPVLTCSCVLFPSRHCTSHHPSSSSFPSTAGQGIHDSSAPQSCPNCHLVSGLFLLLRLRRLLRMDVTALEGFEGFDDRPKGHHGQGCFRCPSAATHLQSPACYRPGRPISRTSKSQNGRTERSSPCSTGLSALLLFAAR